MTTETFSYTGSEQTWTVPDGVEQITVEALGASGADGHSAGENGGRAEADVPVTPGETLYFYVGGAASGVTGGWNGGGDGGNTTGVSAAGGGGGATDVRQGGNALSNRMIVGGGGAGGASASAPNGADNTAGGQGGPNQGESSAEASTYNNTTAASASGGTQSGGNAEGAGGPGSSQSGGGSNDAAGGGGGGGYWGGQGGNTDLGSANVGGSTAYYAAASGGGGGSNYVDANATAIANERGINSGDGQVTISYTLPPPPTNVSATVDADDQITLSWDKDSSGDPIDSYLIEVNRDGNGWVSPAGGPANVADDGSSSYSATYSPSSDSSYDAAIGIDSAFQFRVRSSNSVGSSSWTSSGSVYTTPIPPYAPSTTRADGTSLTIDWTTQSDIENGVEIQYREDTGSGYGAWTTATTTAAGSTSYSASGLPSDICRQYRLRTVGSGGETSAWVIADYGNGGNGGNVYFEDSFESGDLSNWDTTSLADAESGVVNNQATPDTGVAGSAEGSYHLRLDAADAVVKNLGDLSGESDVIVKCVMAVGSMDSDTEAAGLEWFDGSTWHDLVQISWEYNKQGWVEVTALVPSGQLSTDNRLRLHGVDGGAGDDHAVYDRVVVSDILHEYTTPAAPSALSLDASIEDEITASWTVNATFATKQGTKHRPTGSSTWTHHSALAADATTDTFTDLSDGEEYEAFARSTIQQYRRSTGGAFWTADSSTVTAVAMLPPPTTLTVDAITASSVDISWTDNHDYGDTQVQFKQSDASSWTTFSTLSRGTGAETITGLLNGEQYDVRAVAQTEHTTTEDQ